MKKVLKIFTLFSLISLVLLSTGCTKNGNIEASLEDIMTKLYLNIPEEDRPMYLENMEVNDDNIESFIGTNEVKYKEILASESMVGSTAHSVVLIRLENGENVEKVKETIKEKINPRKWICVGIEKDEVIIKNKGNLVLVVVVEDETNRNKISTSFDELN